MAESPHAAPVHAPTPAASQRLTVRAAVWTTVLGAVSGLAAAVVRLSFRGLQWLFTQHGGGPPLAAASLPPWRRVLTPVVGALCATLVLVLRRRRARGLGREPRPYIDYVEAARERHGRIPLVPNLWRTASAAFSVGSGAAVGREGSMIQFAAALTSTLHRTLPQWHVGGRGHRAKISGPALALNPAFAVACGVAGGVATAYSAPVAGLFFAVEIVLGQVRLTDLPLLGLASFAGWLASRPLLGAGPLYPDHPALPHDVRTLLCLLLVACIFGCLGPLYQRLIRGLGAARKLPLALVWGGAAVGLLSWHQPDVWGNGEQALRAALAQGPAGDLSLGAAAVLLVLGLRLLATTLCVGTGTVGGVFTPTLFAGGSVGALLAYAARPLLHDAAPAIFAVAGMSCLIAAATHAPLMATAMAAELTGDWSLLPGLLVLNVIAWQVARRVSPEALYAIASQSPTGDNAHLEDE